MPNYYGGRENLEAIAFLRYTNRTIGVERPGGVTMAEESTDFPGVTLPPDAGGLGFNYKWNMGWMHDTLNYMQCDPVHRKYHHNLMTFGMLYAYTENFILPISHDEVVHGKRSILDRMPGDAWRLLICVPITPLCGRIRARNYCLWDANLRRVVSGISIPAWIGTCWMMRMAGIPVCNDWCATLTIVINKMPTTI